MRRRAALVAVPAALLLFAGPAQAITNPQIPGLQVALREHGFYRGEVDGIAGPMTAQAVRAFQRKARITVDGIAGRQTRRALGKLGRPLWGKRSVLARGMIGWDVSVLEFFLARRKLQPGVVDGRFTDRTAAAVRRLQRKRNLAVDGVAGPQTMAAVRKRHRGGQAQPAAPPPTMLAVQNSMRKWTRYYGISLRLVRALAWMESGFQWNVKSSARAWGALQVTPATWRYVEKFIIAHRVPRTLDGGVRVGVAYLHQMMHEFRHTRRALGAYYQGPYAVRRYGLFGETRHFVRSVLALRSRFSAV
jgi:peptidoglycan hydrolase-like protein with peptidoglycan-binding domain